MGFPKVSKDFIFPDVTSFPRRQFVNKSFQQKNGTRKGKKKTALGNPVFPFQVQFWPGEKKRAGLGKGKKSIKTLKEKKARRNSFLIPCWELFIPRSRLSPKIKSFRD